ALAEHELKVLGGAALKRHAVDLAFEIEGDLIVVLSCAIVTLLKTHALLTQDFQGAIDLGVAHFGAHALDFERFQIGHAHFGIDLDRRHEGKAVFASAFGLRFDLGHTGYAKIRARDG